MTLLNLCEQKLSALGNGGAVVFSVNEGPRNLLCEIEERNALAVSFNSLRLTTNELAEVTTADLQRLSESLSRRLTYLMEPISPIEADAESCTVQLRSNPPQKDDDGRSYFELLIRRGGELLFCRYRKEQGNGRERMITTVTHEVFLRLVSDFSDLLDEFSAKDGQPSQFFSAG